MDVLVNQSGNYFAASGINNPYSRIGKINFGLDVCNLGAADKNICYAFGIGGIQVCIFY